MQGSPQNSACTAAKMGFRGIFSIMCYCSPFMLLALVFATTLGVTASATWGREQTSKEAKSRAPDQPSQAKYNTEPRNPHNVAPGIIMAPSLDRSWQSPGSFRPVEWTMHDEPDPFTFEDTLRSAIYFGSRAAAGCRGREEGQFGDGAGTRSQPSPGPHVIPLHQSNRSPYAGRRSPEPMRHDEQSPQSLLTGVAQGREQERQYYVTPSGQTKYKNWSSCDSCTPSTRIGRPSCFWDQGGPQSMMAARMQGEEPSPPKIILIRSGPDFHQQVKPSAGLERQQREELVARQVDGHANAERKPSAAERSNTNLTQQSSFFQSSKRHRKPKDEKKTAVQADSQEGDVGSGWAGTLSRAASDRSSAVAPGSTIRKPLTTRLRKSVGALYSTLTMPTETDQVSSIPRLTSFRSLET